MTLEFAVLGRNLHIAVKAGIRYSCLTYVLAQKVHLQKATQYGVCVDCFVITTAVLLLLLELAWVSVYLVLHHAM